MGWLVKAVIIYFLIAGLLHATEAMPIKKWNWDFTIR
jgi:hypothetical protein